MEKTIKIMQKEAGHKVYILGNKCYRCSHIWIPRDIEDKPAVCPKCKNPYWSRPRKNKKTKKNEKAKSK